MLRLELVNNTQREVVYNYFPEQENEYGIVSMDKDTGEIGIIKVSPNDMYKRYLFHAVSKIEKYAIEKDFQENDVIAWC